MLASKLNASYREVLDPDAGAPASTRYEVARNSFHEGSVELQIAPLRSG